MTQVGSRRMCLDPDVVPPLAGFRLFAVLGVFTIFSLCFLYAFLKLLTVFDLSFWLQGVYQSAGRTAAPRRTA
jgi:hypothetical protein